MNNGVNCSLLTGSLFGEKIARKGKGRSSPLDQRPVHRLGELGKWLCNW